MKQFVLALALAVIGTGSVEAQTLRSDSPLWTYQNERDPGLYPEHFVNEDSFGCAVPLRLGIYRHSSVDDEGDETFVRIENYGVFHCALIYGETSDRADADSAFEDHAWLIELDKVRQPDGRDERLLALQIGVQAGSRYILLRDRDGDLSSPLEELDWKCPASAERRTARIDVWSQNSCVISSKADLRRVARAASRRPAVATLELLPNDEADPVSRQDR